MVYFFKTNVHSSNISKSVGGHNVPSMFPNNIDSRRIYKNQKCDDEQFVEEKPLKSGAEGEGFELPVRSSKNTI